ncbi:hypothetical protein SAMN05192556_101566 [Halomonas caseinilytica]|uniref:Uncharacterized protein n=2 Tax=Halomonas caseinilytica TaxID=438744 RepID=A0A1M6NZ53_9GAMM|nr:hypothetical protein SAMN04487952_102247 [Halomonas caseinilytica]SHK00920.1 hypothetical protein SAMN05192556_101566 [Halomonas caseinilytica]
MHVIKATALMGIMALLSSMAIADHHEGGMSDNGHSGQSRDMSMMRGNDGEALVKDGGVQSGYNPERKNTGGTLDDEPLVDDGGVQSNYNAEREDPGSILDDGPIVEDGGVQSDYNAVDSL